MDTITSFQNQIFKDIKKIIADKKYRLEKKVFWADGASFVYQAIKYGWNIEKLIYTTSQNDTEFKKSLINSIPLEKRVEFSIDLYSPLSTKDNIQGIGALIKQLYYTNQLTPGLGVVVENISNPGNLGTIMRACSAFNILNLYIINPAVDPFNIETVRSSMSSIFSLNITIFDNIEIMEDELNKHGNYKNIGTSLQNSSDLKKYKHKFKKEDNTLIWFGNEAKGMSDKAKNICDDLLRIEINPNIDSLNISVSAGIFLYELVG